MIYEAGPDGFHIYLKSKGLVYMCKHFTGKGYLDIVMHEIDYINGHAPTLCKKGISLTKKSQREIERDFDNDICHACGKHTKGCYSCRSEVI